MPTVAMPDGTQVQFPDDMPGDQIRTLIQQKFPDASSQSSGAGDIAKSAGTGLAQGAIGMAGLGADIRQGIANLGGKAAVALGADPAKVDAGKQLLDIVSRFVPGPFGGPTSDKLQKTVEQATGPLHQPETTAGKYVKTVAEFAPAALAGPGGLVRRALMQAVLPGMASEAAGEATAGTAAEPYARFAAGVATPVGLSLARRAVTPFTTNPARQASVNTLAGEGVDLTAGQQTGSRALQYLESALGDSPAAGGRATAATTNTAEQFTSAALRRAGIDAQRATPDVMDQAFTRIGGEFDRVAANNTLFPDARLGTDLAAATRNYENVVGPSQRAPIVSNLVQDIADMAARNNGVLPGAVYQPMRSQIGRLARSTTNNELRDALNGIQHALDNGMERSLQSTGNQADIQAWRDARRQYRNMLVLENASTGAGEGAAAGLISPAKLRQAVVAQNKRDYVRGHGDFADLTRAGNELMLPLPQSGTSPRNQALAIPAAIAGGVAGLAVGGPAAAPAAAALGASLGPGIAGRGLMSRPIQAYLANQVLPAAPAVQRAAALRLLLGTSALQLLPSMAP